MPLLLRALLVLLLLPLGCRDEPGGPPASLWLSYEGREVDLVLIDHEPPPF